MFRKERCVINFDGRAVNGQMKLSVRLKAGLCTLTMRRDRFAQPIKVYIRRQIRVARIEKWIGELVILEALS